MLTQTLKFKTSNPLATEPALMKVDEAGSNCLATDVALATELDLPNRSPAASLSSWTLRYFWETWSVLLRKLEIEFPIVSAGILIYHGTPLPCNAQFITVLSPLYSKSTLGHLIWKKLEL